MACVGNRGAWFRANGFDDDNGLSPARIKTLSLDINSPADRALLTSRIDSAAVIARGFGKPYANFAGSNTLAQSLWPFPQFGRLGSLWAPLANTRYESLRIKITNRYSRGLTSTIAYTWSKNLTNVETQIGGIVPTNDVCDRSNQKIFSVNDLPQVLVVGVNHDTPKWNRNWATRTLLSSWTVGGILRYSSGFPIAAPGSNSALGSLLFSGTRYNRVPGEPLCLTDLNDRQSIDPFKQLTLNPKAWSDAGPGEQFSFGRMFKVKERYTISLRGEFLNVFNRTYLNNPDSDNPAATTRTDAAVNITAGFGRINPASVFAGPRNGQVVARFQF